MEGAQTAFIHFEGKGNTFLPNSGIHIPHNRVKTKKAFEILHCPLNCKLGSKSTAARNKTNVYFKRS
jgi:hypothetical protein